MRLDKFNHIIEKIVIKRTQQSIFIAVILISSFCVLGGVPRSDDRKIPDMPMISPPENSLEFEWSQKSVFESKQLSDMENMDNWEHSGFGTLSITDERFYKGNKSLLLTSPTKGEQPTRGRPWGAASAIYRVSGEDWSPWNRITFQVSSVPILVE